MSKYLELVEGSFTQEHLDKQKNQNPYVAYSIKDGKVIYSIIPNEEGTMYTVYRVVSKDISNCTYNMVDLGLSVKWADRNIGATSPEHYGSYFQWGDTNAYTFDGVGEITAAKLAEMLNSVFGSEENEITVDNVSMILELLGITGTDLTNTSNGVLGVLGISLDKEFNWDSYFDTTDSGSTFNKYNNSESGLKVLETSDDAAYIHMGTQYRMPTIYEIIELINNTTLTFVNLDGNEYSIEQAQNSAIERGKLKGVRVTGSNSNSIFIPATSGCVDSLLSNIGEDCILWSSSLHSDIDVSAQGLSVYYDGNVHAAIGYDRYSGLPIRGVQA